MREGTEGPYVGAGGVLAEGTDAEIATEESLNTRRGAERVIRDAFERASKRESQEADFGTQEQRINSCWAVCGPVHLMRLLRNTQAVTTDYLHVDAASMFFVTNPERFDVVVTDNLFRRHLDRYCSCNLWRHWV